jgi:hypothetical protein
MKVKIFEVALHKLPSGKSPATALEEQINEFLVQQPDLRLLATHMSTLVSPAEPNAMPRTEESSIIIFCTLFYRLQNEWYRFMHILKVIYLTILQLVKQVRLLPQSVANAIQQRRRQIVLNEHEAERLDRIRNPSKYLGKWAEGDSIWPFLDSRTFVSICVRSCPFVSDLFDVLEW